MTLPSSPEFPGVLSPAAARDAAPVPPQGAAIPAAVDAPVATAAGSASPAGPEGVPAGGNTSGVRAVQAARTPGIHDAMSEVRLDAAIRRILKDLPQILWYHTHDSRRSPGGFPDLVCVGPRGVLYRELKTARGKLSGAQETWLMQLRAARQDMDVWRPEDLLSGRIARELAALAGMVSPP